MKLRQISALGLASLALCCCSIQGASAAQAQMGSAQTAPDNSAHNKKQNQGATADQQPNAKEDRLATAKVRRAIIADKGLLTYAHNVKIIIVGGAVTLKGPVKSEEEKQKVASDAASALSVDASKVSNELTIKQ